MNNLLIRKITSRTSTYKYIHTYEITAPRATVKPIKNELDATGGYHDVANASSAGSKFINKHIKIIEWKNNNNKGNCNEGKHSIQRRRRRNATIQ